MRALTIELHTLPIQNYSWRQALSLLYTFMDIIYTFIVIQVLLYTFIDIIYTFIVIQVLLYTFILFVHVYIVYNYTHYLYLFLYNSIHFLSGSCNFDTYFSVHNHIKLSLHIWILTHFSIESYAFLYNHIDLWLHISV